MASGKEMPVSVTLVSHPALRGHCGSPQVVPKWPCRPFWKRTGLALGFKTWISHAGDGATAAPAHRRSFSYAMRSGGLAP